MLIVALSLRVRASANASLLSFVSVCELFRLEPEPSNTLEGLSLSLGVER
jgi:hypothetical protein